MPWMAQRTTLSIKTTTTLQFNSDNSDSEFDGVLTVDPTHLDSTVGHLYAIVINLLLHVDHDSLFCI